MKYTVEQLKNYDNLIVVHIETKQQWEILKQKCPNITEYDYEYKYYLAPNKGYAREKETYSNNYNIIEFEDICDNNIIENFEFY